MWLSVTPCFHGDGKLSRTCDEIGVFIPMQPPTGPMRREVATGEAYGSPWGKHPRIQLLTIEDLLVGGRVDMPPLGLSKTSARVTVTRSLAPPKRASQSTSEAPKGAPLRAGTGRPVRARSHLRRGASKDEPRRP